MKWLAIIALGVVLACPGFVRGAPVEDRAPAISADLVRGLALRSLGPAVAPGRVGDIAIDPTNRSTWYVAVASGGVWKTTNRGITWTPIFDDAGSYSIGCITIDPTNPQVLWVGTGENQSQRSVSYGDGVYRSEDGGKTWKNMGLGRSEHIAKIVVDPKNPQVVYVVAQGPLWAAGGERGLYKTSDAGRNWQRILHIGEDTGVTDIVMDPRDPARLYAASWQRRRNVGALVGGGPESAIYRSEDAGKSWKKLAEGLPANVDVGRIALALSPQDPDVVYALVVAAGKQSGFFRSSDRGETFARQSDYRVVDPQYYGEIYPDPHKIDRVYAVDMIIHRTDDGGKTCLPVQWPIHVDNHAIAFDAADSAYLLVGNDGGLYESYDSGQTWRHFTNLPTLQFYRLAIDDALPFYHIYGGAQDNGSLAGPSRTANRAGIRNSDWNAVGGGDGMGPLVERGNPLIAYSQAQEGDILRLDRREGTSVNIMPKIDGEKLRWNWDTPALLSPHAPARLYMAANRLFRSDDRGASWKAISPDLTRQVDVSSQEVMGRLWGPEAVCRNLFTTAASVASALAESPRREGLLYVGTDDGLVQISENGGGDWRAVDRFPGVPAQSYVSDLCASQHDEQTIYVTFNNWQRGDFRPYILKSEDRGRSWRSIAADLPDRSPVWCIVEDHERRDLLFVGTEHGLFFSIDSGGHWVPLQGGVPVVAMRDLEIQRRESDLVAASFGRGFFVLDDYSPLRRLDAATLAADAALFPVRKVLSYRPRRDVIAAGGDFTTPNPPFGALLTYHLRQPADGIVLVVSDDKGSEVSRIKVPGEAGLHRVNWDLRLGKMDWAQQQREPAEVEEEEEEAEEAQAADVRLEEPATGPATEPATRPTRRQREEQRLAGPGRYSVRLARQGADGLHFLGEAQAFEVVGLYGESAKGNGNADQDD